MLQTIIPIPIPMSSGSCSVPDNFHWWMIPLLIIAVTYALRVIICTICFMAYGFIDGGIWKNVKWWLVPIYPYVELFFIRIGQDLIKRKPVCPICRNFHICIDDSKGNVLGGSCFKDSGKRTFLMRWKEWSEKER